MEEQKGNLNKSIREESSVNRKSQQRMKRAVMAGISSGIGASQMQKGSIDVTMNYDETTIGNNLTANWNIEKL